MFADVGHRLTSGAHSALTVSVRRGTMDAERRPVTSRAALGRKARGTRIRRMRYVSQFVPRRKSLCEVRMSEYPYLPLFTAEFIASTTHLSAEETGAYLMLLMMAWQSPGASLPDDDRKLAAWARVDAATWRTIKLAVMEFWQLSDGQWHQKRLTKERAHVASVSDARRGAAKARWTEAGRDRDIARHRRRRMHMQKGADANALQVPSNCNAHVLHSHLHPSKEIGREGVPRSEVGGTRARARARDVLPWDGDDA
jgi:uncharacterized protein YdaU (DUF1376 family)